MATQLGHSLQNISKKLFNLVEHNRINEKVCLPYQNILKSFQLYQAFAWQNVLILQTWIYNTNRNNM